jgi:hypothetical protein
MWSLGRFGISTHSDVGMLDAGLAWFVRCLRSVLLLSSSGEDVGVAVSFPFEGVDLFFRSTGSCISTDDVEGLSVFS